MNRILATLLILALPLSAVGQTVAKAPAGQAPLPASTLYRPGSDTLAWRDAGGGLLIFGGQGASGASQLRVPFSSVSPDGAVVSDSGLRYMLAPGVQAHAEVRERSWANPASRVLGSEVGATYFLGRYSLGLSVGADNTPANDQPAALPRVLPGAVPGIDGLYAFDSSSHLSASGRVALGKQSGIDMGASVGRIHLLPGNLMGVNTLDQKSLSFGVDHGPISGVITGRSMEPMAGVPGSYNLDQRWSSIDLGVTWRLPWSGSLSVGAQNVWSSGNPASTPVGPEPDQSRTPYVQYHQDL